MDSPGLCGPALRKAEEKGGSRPICSGKECNIPPFPKRKAITWSSALQGNIAR